MSTQLDLKEIERKAFRSTYQDGLWDIYFGVIVICMAVFIIRPAGGYCPVNIVLAVCAMAGAYSLFWAAKKYITLPRMGQVRFGEPRTKRRQTLAILGGVVVLIQVVFIALQLYAMEHPEIGVKLNAFLKDRDAMNLAVASIGALFVCPGMLLVAYFRDFSRGYYIAILMGLAVFLTLYLNQPVYPILIGGLIVLPGLVLLARFMKTYPLQPKEPSNG
jgi:hypothetical protein